MLGISQYSDQELREELERRYEPTEQEQIAWKYAREQVPAGDFLFCEAVANENWPPDILLGIAKKAITNEKDADLLRYNYIRGR